MTALIALVSALAVAPAPPPPDTLRPGAPTLRPFAVEPGEQVYTMTLVLPDRREAVGTIVETTLVRGDTVSLVRHYDTQGQATTDSSVATLPTLAPVFHRLVRDETRGAIPILKEAAFAPGRVETRIQQSVGPVRDSTVTLAEAVFGAGWTRTLLEALPLADGYSAVLATFDPEFGHVPVTVSVAGTETVEAQGGPVEAWTVQVEQRGCTATYAVGKASGTVLRTRTSSNRSGVFLETAPAD